MGHAAAHLVDVGATQVLDRDHLAGDGLDDVRAGQEHGARAAGHDHEVGQGRGVDRAAGTRSEDHRQLRDDPRRQHVADEDLPVGREAGDALLDPRATRVVQPDQRHPALEGEILDAADLVRLDARERTAEHREVLREDRDTAAVDLAEAGHDAVARVALLGQAEIGLVVCRERAHLLERTLIDEEVQTLAGGQLASRVLLFHARPAAPLERCRAHGAQNFEMVSHA